MDSLRSPITAWLAMIFSTSNAGVIARGAAECYLLHCTVSHAVIGAVSLTIVRIGADPSKLA